MGKFSLTGIEKTELDKISLYQSLNPHLKKLKYPVEIWFDSRTKLFGYHGWNESKKIHLIKISVNKNTISDDFEATIHLFLGTILHELKHAMQQENGTLNFEYTSEIKTEEWLSYYSRMEIEARMYELKHVLKAVKAYKKAIRKSEHGR